MSNDPLKIQILIPTCNRPQQLASLRDSINRKAALFEHEQWTSIFEDTEAASCEEHGINYSYYMTGRRYGKENFWQFITFMFSKLIDADYYFFIADDMELCDSFFERAISTYDNIQDDKKICLSLYMPKGREDKPNWTNIVPTKVKFEGTEVLRTQWNDLCFVAKKDFFEALEYKINPISYKRWQKDPLRSSGVGEQISHRLHKAGYYMYHTIESLVTHGDHDSVMNPIERKLNPLI